MSRNALALIFAGKADENRACAGYVLLGVAVSAGSQSESIRIVHLTFKGVRVLWVHTNSIDSHNCLVTIARHLDHLASTDHWRDSRHRWHPADRRNTWQIDLRERVVHRSGIGHEDLGATRNTYVTIPRAITYSIGSILWERIGSWVIILGSILVSRLLLGLLDRPTLSCWLIKTWIVRLSQKYFYRSIWIVDDPFWSWATFCRRSSSSNLILF